MRKILVVLLSLSLLGAMPLQAWAQSCALRCALAQGGMQQMDDQRDGAVHQPQAPEQKGSCAHAALCQVAQSVQFSVIPATLGDMVFAGGVLPPEASVQALIGRHPPPLDRPPILS
ncbi:MAG: hypothetical protein EPO06_09675 [Burkholderiaceae bacterium]|nr:MAG: hypothetical protein EPO06_09675 [Burkholderiaceae bacterium]